MSGRVRKQSECPVGKQGPMRATLPVSSIMKQAGGIRKSCGNSPTLSPTNVWRRISPDHALSGQRSPGAANYKGKGRFGENSIRRTASLDTLYHKGHWPRDFYLHAGLLQVDKATQRRGWPSPMPCQHVSTMWHFVIAAYSTSVGDGVKTEDIGAGGRSSRGPEEDKLERFLRARLQRIPHTASQIASPPFYGSLRHGSSGIPLRAARSSVEGLNQEIERLVLHPATGSQTSNLDRHRNKVTPEGHRAPLAELLRRSVNTQTPHDPSCATHSSGGSVCSSPDPDGSRLGTSPHINRFLAREPPDGCEKVNLKPNESSTVPKVTHPAYLGSLIKPSVTGFQLRPSLGSAFQPLQPPVTSGECGAKKSLDFRKDSKGSGDE